MTDAASQPCDALWLVDPSTCEAWRLNDQQERVGTPFCCYTALGKDRRCENCIGAVAVSEGSRASKFEFDDAYDAFFMSAHPAKEQNHGCAIEMVEQVNDQIGLHEGGVRDFARRVHEATDSSVLDELTGAFNRSYFDRGFSGLTECKFAMARVENLDLVQQQHGYRTSDAMLKAVCEAIRSCVGKADTIIRYEENTFALQFGDLPDEEFLSKIEDICDVANAVRLPDYPSLEPNVIVGAVDEEGLVVRLAGEVERLLAHAERVGRKVVLYSDHLQHRHVSLREASFEEILTHGQMDALDELTGLMSPLRFREHLQEVIDDPQHVTCGYAVVHFDVENFKTFNRAYGFKDGDLLLRYIAGRLGDLFADEPATRLAVDRFVVLTRCTNIVETAERLHDDLRNHQEHASLELKCGAFSLVGTVTDASTAMDHAKTACESIKGRYDTVCRFYDEELDRHIAMSHYVTSNVDKAVEKDWIKVFYQPVVRAATGDVCGFEALCRWDDPNLGLLSPLDFISTLERTHLIHKVDACVVDLVCRHLAEQLAAGEVTVPVSVNLSRLDFQLCDIFEVVEQTVELWGVPRSLLAIEVTESALDEDADFFRACIDRFRSVGYEVWMDDFGSGYSSLNLLKDYGFDLLKIDMGFLRGFERNQKSREIIVTVVDMAKRLGVRTLVEGVETEAQRGFLRRIGCEMLQGFLFDRPRPLGDPERRPLGYEDLAERAYYDAVGSVNLLGPVPEEENSFVFVTDSEQRTVPLAIIELRGGRLGYLSANEAYLRMVEGVRPDFLDEAHDALNAGASELLAPLRGLVNSLLDDDAEAVIVCDLGGVPHEMRVHHIASTDQLGMGLHSGADAFLVTVDEKE